MSQCNPTLEEIASLVDALETASMMMSSQNHDEDVVIFLGTTKAGKSTLINFLLGNELLGEQTEPFLPISIRKINYDCGPAIGEGTTSETMIPTRWENVRMLPGLILWDAPGFEDNRGPIQDIVNAYYIYELFKMIRSIKVVLVVNFTDIINDNINPFLSLLNAIENIFRSMMTDFFPSIVITFSKVPNKWSDTPVDMSFICQMLEHKILHNATVEISPVCWNFVHHLIENYYQIGLFKMANVGIIDNDIDGGVTSAILTAQSISCEFLKEVVCPSLADTSQRFLHKARKNLLPTKSFQELLNVVQEVFEDELKMHTVVQQDEEAKDTLQMIHDQLITHLNKTKEVLDPNTNFQQKIDLLQGLDHRIGRKIFDVSFLERSRLMQFIDQLLDLRESKDFDACTDSILMEIQSEIEKLVFAVQVKLGNITKDEYDKRMEEMKHKYEKEIVNLKSELNSE